MRLIQEIINEAREAVLHGDAWPAWRCLSELIEAEKTVSVDLPLSEINTLKASLKYTAFPVIPIEDAVSLLRSEIISFLTLGMDLEDRLSVRYAFTTYGDHENERQAFKKAMLENKEQVGEKTIGQWLKEFDKAFPLETRESRHIFEFLSNNRQLSGRNRTILNLILLAYENWISTERLNIFDIAYLKQHPELTNEAASRSVESEGPYVSAAANRVYQESRVVSGKSGKGVLKLPLLKALSEYPRLGDQLITNEKIKIKSQAEPVRPSLTNWIHYYREELGIGFHDQVTRGHFLFQSENGKRLSAEERERINLILKSIEEEFPIDIDADRQTIVFPVKQTGAPTAPFGGAAQPATNPLFPRQSPVPARPVKPFQPAAPQDLPTAESVPTPSAASKPSFFDRQFRPAKNVAGDTLHFSTGHVLPGEKNAESGVAAPQSRPTVSTPPPSSFRPRGIVQDRGAALPRSPYSIRPLRMRDDDEVAS